MGEGKCMCHMKVLKSHGWVMQNNLDPADVRHVEGGTLNYRKLYCPETAEVL